MIKIPESVRAAKVIRVINSLRFTDYEVNDSVLGWVNRQRCYIKSYDLKREITDAKLEKLRGFLDAKEKEINRSRN